MPIVKGRPRTKTLTTDILEEPYDKSNPDQKWELTHNLEQE